MLRLEAGRQLGHVLVAETERRQDAQAPDQRILAVMQRLLQFVHVGQDQARPLEQQFALVGQADAAALPVDQFQLQLLFDTLQALGDGGGRDIQ